MVVRTQTDKKKLFSELKRLIIKNPLLFACTILVCVLSYGFFATQYTYHVDSLESTYYDSTNLIGAGRVVAPLIHWCTNWMSAAPFWQTVMLCVFLITAGLVCSVLLRRESANRIQDSILYLFIMLFVSSPIMVGQLTFPNLNIGLSFVLVPLSLWILDPFGRKFSVKKSIAGCLLLAAAIDMYESFASVYLVVLFSLLLVHVLISEKDEKMAKADVLRIMKTILFAIGILAAAIIIEYLISKLLCRLLTGTFDFWYSNNTTTHWQDTTSSLFTSIKKLICYFTVDFFLAPAEYFWAFLFTATTLVLGVVTMVVLLKNVRKFGGARIVIGIFSYLAMVAASKSLDLILCRPASLNQMQGVMAFIPFAGAVVGYCLTIIKIPVLRRAAFAVMALAVLLQSQQLNQFAVKNQERFRYENNILTDVVEELSAIDLEGKSVCFYTPNDYALPSAFAHRPSSNPAAKILRQAVFGVWDICMPQMFFDYLNRYFSWAGNFFNAESCLQIRICLMPSEVSYIGWVSYLPENWTAPHETLLRLGLNVQMGEADRPAMDRYYADTDFEPGEKFRIVETDDIVTVVFVTPT